MFALNDEIAFQAFPSISWIGSSLTRIWAQKCEKQLLAITWAGTKHDVLHHAMTKHVMLSMTCYTMLPRLSEFWLTAEEHHQDGGELLKAGVGSHVAKPDACQGCENEIHTRDVSRLQEERTEIVSRRLFSERGGCHCCAINVNTNSNRWYHGDGMDTHC